MTRDSQKLLDCIKLFELHFSSSLVESFTHLANAKSDWSEEEISTIIDALETNNNTIVEK